MKLSSSASCGCCFCCYCRSWLMMLLMVSSVIHVSPEMTTTTTTNTNLNNYYEAMTKSTKFNTKLPGRTGRLETSSTRSPPDAHKGNNKQAYPTTLQPDMATALATTQAPSTSATTEPSSPEQTAMTRQSLYETRPTSQTEERRRRRQDLFYRSSTSDTPALNGDNYDVVIRTTATTDFIESMETIGVAATRNVQIAALDGDINNDSKSTSKSKNLKYPRIESSASEEHKHRATTTARTQSTEHVSGNHDSLDSHDSLRAVYGTNQYENNAEVQNTNIGQTTRATVSSNPRTKQYNPNPRSTSSANVIPSSNTSHVIKAIGKVSGTSSSSTHMPPASHLQRTGSDTLQLEYNQLKRPALLALSSQPLHRQRRQVEEVPIDKCRMFNEGDPAKYEFYSPDYPNVYPKNINCTRVLTAQKGQIIRLDFRNSFHIEAKEDCKFDFLEIRDGPYGFSNQIGKYCGSDFPPEITSKERWLWLHFHSDESIEYEGFTVVYEFIDKTRDAPNTDYNCTIEKGGSEGFINHTDIPQEMRTAIAVDKINLDCMWSIRVHEKWKIQVKFIEFKLSKPNECYTNFLDIFPEETIMPMRLKSFCGSTGETMQSDSNVLNMRFFAEPAASNATFSILYTAFRDRNTRCTDNEYDCEDNTCIDRSLKCNGRDNCKFQWDEEGCTKADEEQSEHMTIIITVFGLILGGMVITFLVNCVRKIMHDQKIIRDVPVLSDGIYHIDSFVLDAPKTAIFVGLQDDYKQRYSPGHEAQSGHENTMAMNMNDDPSSSLSAAEYHSDSDTSQVDANSVNCCSSYPVADTLTGTGSHNDDDILFDNDEFIIVPQVPPKLITAHCNLHSGIMILSQHKDLTSPPLTTDSCHSSPSPGTDSSEELNYDAKFTDFSLAIHPDPLQANQSFMQKCVQ